MLAVDTNVLVRFLTRDDPAQSSRAAALFRGQEVWIAKSVLLETGWVLRSSYNFPEEQLVSALRSLIGLPNVNVEDSVGVALALDWASQGLNLADALHLVSSGEAQRFVTFDGKLAKRARKITPVEVVAL